jgi:tetratricopeptide (TPR) repeat protein
MPIKRIYEISPEVRVCYHRALKARDDNKLPLATDLLLHVVSQEPEFFEAHKQLHEVMKQSFALGAILEALNYLKTGAAMLTTMPQLAFGWAALRQGRPKEAMIFAYKMLNQDPTNTQGLDLLIRAAEELGIHEVAALAAEEAVSASPHNVAFLVTLVHLYRRAEQFFEALGRDRVLEEPPDNLDILSEETRTAVEARNWELCVAFIRLDFPPAQRDAAQRLAVALAKVIGKRIIHLRPDCTLREILSWADEEFLDCADPLPLARMLDQARERLSLSGLKRSQKPDPLFGMTFQELVSLVGDNAQ